MFNAQYLPASTVVFSPWFSREGDGLIATLDLIASYGSNQITVRAFTKNQEDMGDGADVKSAIKIETASVGRASATWPPDATNGIKELVRYQFTTNATGTGVLFRMLSPVWFDSAKPAG